MFLAVSLRTLVCYAEHRIPTDMWPTAWMGYQPVTMP